MTKIIHRQKLAEELLLGDMFTDWAIGSGDEWVYGPPSRVLNITEKNGRIYVDLDNMSRTAFYPGQIVVVEERV